MSIASCDGRVRVAVPIPLRRLLTYGVSGETASRATAGTRVLVQVGRRRMTGIVIGPDEGPEAPRGLRPVLEVLDPEPILSEELLSFVLRAADYYLYPPGEALRAALPPGMATAERAGRMRRPRREPAEVLHVRLASPLPGDPGTELHRAPARARLLERIAAGGEVPVQALRRGQPGAKRLVDRLAEDGWVELVRRPLSLDPLLADGPGRAAAPTLTDDQEAARAAVVAAVEAGGYRAFLLHGVTGSGKTEVYIRVIEAALARGLSALVLVPEIALTPQLVSRFRERLGATVGLLHSGLAEAERLREWSRIRRGEARVAIGARSAVFAPVSPLGVVVVDEEHDPSFKQDEGFRYNGRDLALLRARRAGAVAVLGSATPSLESSFGAEAGKLARLLLPRRVTPRPLPEVEVVDLRRHRSGPAGQRLVTEPVATALRRAVAAGGQAIVFLNRRGYAPVAICGSCGEAVRCPGCSVALTFHRTGARLECHYCAHTRSVPSLCPACGAAAIRLLGAGTERVEETLRDLLGPAVRVGRLDSDVAPGRASEPVLDRVRRGETDVLVGTQLVTKGHDLPGVTVVAVLLADGSLHLPDFRAAERTFQLLTQVAGRAGRGEIEGRVLVQTFDPDHPAVRHAAAHDYEAFYRGELAARLELGYPPHAHLAAVRLSGRVEERVLAEADRIAVAARQHGEVRGGAVSVAGPAPAPLARLRDRFRYRVLLRAASRPRLRRVLHALAPELDGVRNAVRASFDVDPVHMM